MDNKTYHVSFKTLFTFPILKAEFTDVDARIAHDFLLIYFFNEEEYMMKVY